MIYLSNAFSLSMVSQVLQSQDITLKVSEISLNEVKSLLNNNDFISAVGHSSTAEILTLLTETEIPANRISVSLRKGDKIVVFQLLARLEEGKVLTKEELSNVQTKFYLVEI